MTGIELAGKPYGGDDSGLLRPPATAVGLSAIRGLSRGRMRQYSAVEFERGWPGVDRFIRALRACGYVRPSSAEPSYGVLDVIDANGEIVFDYDVVSATAMAYIRRKLGLTVVSEPD